GATGDYAVYVFICKQFDKLTDLAQEKGSAIGIGHVGTGGKQMYAALKHCIPLIKARGVVFVPVSVLLKK
ncbi:MAG TPA: divergent polysaccharide deacetylase family protein, partial [Bacillota bacterium]|nr:divergent polysaccharide deacetylase family protein [Bacillota bacterium]